MLTREQLKQKYEAFHEHFNFKDFLGLSALIFGLLMSNSSFDTGPAEVEPIPMKPKTTQSVEKKAPETEAIQVPKKKMHKKVMQIPKKKRQPITASSKTL